MKKRDANSADLVLLLMMPISIAVLTAVIVAMAGTLAG